MGSRACGGGSGFRAHAAHFEEEFFKDMDALGCRPPNLVTRVSEYIPEIIEYVETIIANGMAYAVNGSVYFNTAEFRLFTTATLNMLNK